MKDTKKETLPLVNEQIQARSVQLILADGANAGIVSRLDALRAAESAGLDLVLLADQGSQGAPVVKIMDFGKVLYEKKKKRAEAKKHQKVIQVKEIKVSPKIGEHDYQIKIRQAVQFLKDGKRVKITLFFKGRENVLKEERGSEFFERVHKSFEEYDLGKSLAYEHDAKIGKYWSRIYYLKELKGIYAENENAFSG